MDGSKVIKNLLEAIGLCKKDTAKTASGGQGVPVAPPTYAEYACNFGVRKKTRVYGM